MNVDLVYYSFAAQESRLPVFVFNCFPQELIAAERRLETLKGNRVPVTT